MDAPDFYLHVSIAQQRLDVMRHGRIEHSYPVATAKNGAGEQRGSHCTPRGWHRIRAKIGAGLPLGAVLVGRRFTGEIYSAALAAEQPERDWILTRILWLGGLEPGKNRYGAVDSAWRYIYLHGSPDHGVDGVPASHGCIRLKSPDIAALFAQVPAGTAVYVAEA